jgi:hypothetical protein
MLKKISALSLIILATFLNPTYARPCFTITLKNNTNDPTFGYSIVNLRTAGGGGWETGLHEETVVPPSTTSLRFTFQLCPPAEYPASISFSVRHTIGTMPVDVATFGASKYSAGYDGGAKVSWHSLDGRTCEFKKGSAGGRCELSIRLSK